MCMSMASGQFANTLGYAGTVGDRHTFWYQNVAAQPQPGPNAMLLHVPVAPGTRVTLLDTTGCPHVLTDMRNAVVPPTRGMPDAGAGDMLGVEIVEMGPYHVVIAADPAQIPAALKRVPVAKRPHLQPDLFAFYQTTFPGWAMLCCCFNGTGFESLPIAVVYTPRDFDRIFFPALDGHTGHPPALTAPVTVDHVLCFGTDRPITLDDAWAPPEYSEARSLSRDFVPVRYSDTLPAAIRPILPDQVLGVALVNRQLPNGDFMLRRADLEHGALYLDRVSPQEWQAGSLPT